MFLFAGTDGIVIIDTTESGESALKIYEEFRKITTKPIKGVIYTHFHLGMIIYTLLIGLCFLLR